MIYYIDSLTQLLVPLGDSMLVVAFNESFGVRRLKIIPLKGQQFLQFYTHYESWTSFATARIWDEARTDKTGRAILIRIFEGRIER